MDTLAMPVSLAKEFRKLLQKRNFILSRAEKAKEKNETINADVLVWLDEVDKLIQEMNSTGKKKGASVIALPPAENYYFSSMKDASEKLLKALEDDKNHVIGLFGKRGMGKTTLVKSEISKYEKMFSRVIFLNMFKKSMKSMYAEIANSLNLHFQFEEDDYVFERDDHTDNKRKEIIQSELIGREDVTTLVILDNFPTKFSLKDLGISDRCAECDRCTQCKVKVLLITDDEAVCTKYHYKYITQLKMNCDKSVFLERISDEEAWELLQNLTTTGVDSKSFNVAREVAFKCKGSPGLIHDMVSSLDLDDNKNNTTMAERWAETLDNLRHSTASHQIYISDSIPVQFGHTLRDALEEEGFKIADALFFSRDSVEAFGKVIEQSRCSIIYITASYAYSFKRLRELVQILKCKEETKQLVVPIFYQVDPSAVRDVRGSIQSGLESAIKEAKMDETYDVEKEDMIIKEWTSALYQVGSLPGKRYIKGSERKFIQEIVAYIQNNKHRLHLKHVNSQEGVLCSFDKNCKGYS